jgi:hypothetical protein
VEDQRVAAVGVDQAVFGAAPKPDHRAPVSRCRDRPASARRRSGARASTLASAGLEDLGQAANGGLDFGKLGHAGDMAEALQAR